MQRAVIAVSLALFALTAPGCDSPPPSGSTGAAATASTTTSSETRTMAPMSPSAMNDQPLPVPTVAASAEAPETITAQHLLVAYKGAKDAVRTITRSKVEAKKRAEEALAKAKKGDDFSELVKTYSDEPGAAGRLGSLGRFKREAMVKPFADAAFALKVGDVSEVVETDFGFHVIRRNQ